ncbi:hypothetical protein HAT2_00698 [Candidatus Similichlamydia laticola]|uniref:Uncharacterized protein n=2 Tax=Candidatus Similichlamydia laticola TaxID=2170265 RepID=A0A369KBC8_9BACT|nr:hypothetical protein HAT2_00698 [Candidatus Similichlamydia laticola]
MSFDVAISAPIKTPKNLPRRLTWLSQAALRLFGLVSFINMSNTCLRIFFVIACTPLLLLPYPLLSLLNRSIYFLLPLTTTAEGCTIFSWFLIQIASFVIFDLHPLSALMLTGASNLFASPRTLLYGVQRITVTNIVSTALSCALFHPFCALFENKIEAVPILKSLPNLFIQPGRLIILQILCLLWVTWTSTLEEQEEIAKIHTRICKKFIKTCLE